MPLVDVLIVVGAVVIIAVLVLVIRANRKDEKDVWKTPEDFGDPEDHHP
jgi:FtsZ-interacting cell division protein ZipA